MMFERLSRNPLGWLFIALGALFILNSTVSFVPETKQGVVVRFGEPVRIFNGYDPKETIGNSGAGIYVRMPFADQVQWIKKQTLSLDMEEQEVLSTDQFRLQVDAYARYRITNPLRMYKAVRTEDALESALKPLLSSSLRDELGKQTSANLLTPERGTIMTNIRNQLNRRAAQYGAEVIDVRIIRAELPKGAPLDAAFERMRTARKQEADAKRAEGWKEAQIIRANADAEAARIYAASFGKDAEFYDFYRAMQSYKTTFVTSDPKTRGNTNLILSPGNDYLREFRGKP
jgi:modulator of FtsH protease HflC